MNEEGGLNIKNLLKKHWPFLIIFVLGFFLRAFKAIEWFPYSHDNDLNGWIVRDILEDRHLRLIGQETASSGAFIGPLYYYLLIPFYLLFKMDPKGTVILPILISGVSIFSFYFVFSKIFNQRVGVFASLIYSISTLIVFTEREAVPTQPVMLWTVWFLYGLWLLAKGKGKALILLGLLLGLAWNFSLALVILVPLIPVALVVSRKKLDLTNLTLGILALIISLSPFLAFEARHNFSQTKAIYTSLVSDKDYAKGTARGYAKFDRVMQLVNRNTTRLVWGSDYRIPGNLTFLILVFSLAIFSARIFSKKNLLIIAICWLGLFLTFFTLNFINISEYYLNGMNVIWIGVLATSIDKITRKNYLAGFIFILIILTANILSFVKHPVVTNGYVNRKQLVEFIKNDAKNHGYPCISVSFIVSPGNDLGYRYFFWLSGLHVNHPDSGSPVYTIVFPHTMVGRLDRSFGSLGLVFPGYERYTRKMVEESCRGEDSNVTDPMLKFTK